MKRSALIIAIALLITALPAMAQRAGDGTGPAVDPSEALDVYGTVVSFTASVGSGMPRLVVDEAALGEIEIGLGPLWFIQEAGFGADAGDVVEATVFPCDSCAAEYVAQVVENVTTGTSVTLRGEDGRPLWRGRGGTGGGQGFCRQSGTDAKRSGQGGRGGNGSASGQGAQNDQGANPGDFPGGQCQWTGPDMTAVATVTGTVVSVDVTFGNPRPSVVLDVDGEEIEILLRPYAPLAAAGFLIEVGSELQVTYAPWVLPDEVEVLVAISVTDPATGLTVQLRDPETGYPIGGGRGHRHGAGPDDGTN